ncbi:hypothetical protein [Streptomyces phaeochromogenes]
MSGLRGPREPPAGWVYRLRSPDRSPTGWSLPRSGAGRISVPVPAVYALDRPRTPRDLSVVADDEG